VSGAQGVGGVGVSQQILTAEKKGIGPHRNGSKCSGAFLLDLPGWAASLKQVEHESPAQTWARCGCSFAIGRVSLTSKRDQERELTPRNAGLDAAPFAVET
jgi:hypothetical protein